MIEFDQTQYPN